MGECLYKDGGVVHVVRLCQLKMLWSVHGESEIKMWLKFAWWTRPPDLTVIPIYNP